MFSAQNSQVAGSATSGEAIFTNASGTTSWTVPAGVTSVSAVCIGGGGGGCSSTSGGSGGAGGDLRYYNNLSVTPGETLTITVGSRGNRGSVPTSGGYSRIARSGTTLLEAAGGGAGSAGGSGAGSGTSTTISGSIGGGNGGVCPDPATTVGCGGGGGAGGYSGNGGDANFGAGANGIDAATNSGAGGSGGNGGDADTAGNGGGVNVFGLGADGIAGLGSTANGYTAPGGSYGDGALHNDLSTTATGVYQLETQFGAGGGGADNTTGLGANNGGQGCVRIVWPGTTRSFPSTDVWMSQDITTVIETQTNVTLIDIPASAQAGDLAILAHCANTSGVVQADPSGWTRIINQEANNPTVTVWYRILQSGDAGSTVSGITGGATEQSSEMILFRKSSGTISSVSVIGQTIAYSSAAVASQTQNASTASGPFILVGVASFSSTNFRTANMNFFGGLAGSGNYEPSAVFTVENGDPSRQLFMRFRIYDEAPSANVTVDMPLDVLNQTMGSFIIEVS